MTISDSYPLGRNAAEASRLNTQHEIWQRNLGYLIHPLIESRIATGSRVADIGTGSGIFLLELAKKFPSTCRFHGFDISGAQFPQSTPENVALSVHDARKGFESSLHGTYDVVHLRLLVTALDKDDWDLVLTHAIQLLAPGGAIQWTEADTLGSHLLRGVTVAEPVALQQFADYFHRGMRHRLQHGHKTLPDVFRGKALQDVFQDVVSSDREPDTRKAFTQISYDAMVGWALHVARQKIPDTWTPEEVEQVRKRCQDEIDTGAYCRFEIYTTIGFTKAT